MRDPETNPESAPEIDRESAHRSGGQAAVLLREEELLAALRSLPAVRPRPGFRGRVLARLDVPRRSFAGRPRLALAALTGLLLVAALATPLLRRQVGHDERAARIADLRREQEALLGELEALRQDVGSATAPVIYLGGDDDTDLVLDLGRLAERRARPAAYHPEL